MFNTMIELDWSIGDLIDYVTWCDANGFNQCDEFVLDTFVALMDTDVDEYEQIMYSRGLV